MQIDRLIVLASLCAALSACGGGGGGVQSSAGFFDQVRQAASKTSEEAEPFELSGAASEDTTNDGEPVAL